MTPLLETKNLERVYRTGETELRVLKNLNLTIHAGELIAIMGTSGSGKSTLMNILGCLDRPTGGSYRINGKETGDLTSDELAALRREYFGFIFQNYHLLPHLDAIRNTEMPAIYAGVKKKERRDRAERSSGETGAFGPGISPAGAAFRRAAAAGEHRPVPHERRGSNPGR